MKVCTDACIFGAFVANQIVDRQLKTDTILDIGGGTGLLSLMMSQKTAAIIDVIEIDAAAVQQAINNFGQSPWKQRLRLHHTDALQYSAEIKYDFIISNHSHSYTLTHYTLLLVI